MHRPEFRRPRRLAKGLLNAACFIAALEGGALVVGLALPFPPVPDVFAKYQYLAENRQQFDTLFVGSSRVFHQIDPQQFDAEVAALGGRTRSLNLGYSGMWPPESFFFLRQILALRPPRLRWVFLELMQINLHRETRDAETLRTAYWHDWRHTLLAERDILASPRPAAEKRRLAVEDAVIFLRWNVGLGRGSEWLRERLLPGKPARTPRWRARAGFLPENDRQISAAGLPDFLARVAGLRLAPPATPVSAHYYEALQALVAEVRRAGAQPIFLITPSLGGEDLTGLPAGVPVFAFTDPAKYPTLYEPDRHYDEWHLNEWGAAELTSLLAQRFVEHLRQP